MILGSPVNSPEPDSNGKYCNNTSKTTVDNTQSRCEQTATIEHPVINVLSPINSPCSSQEDIIDIEASVFELFGGNEAISENPKADIGEAKSTDNLRSLQKSRSRKFVEPPPFDEVIPVSKRLRSQDSMSRASIITASSSINTPVSKTSTKAGEKSTSTNVAVNNTKNSKNNVAFNAAASKATSNIKNFVQPRSKSLSRYKSLKSESLGR